MWRKLVQTFVHPMGIFAYALLLARIAQVWEMLAVVAGAELIMLRHHHRSYQEHEGSVFDADWVAVVGIGVFFVGECSAIALRSPMMGLLLPLVAAGVQLLSFGWHERQHHRERELDAVLKILAGIMISFALTIAVVAFCLGEAPS